MENKQNPNPSET